MYMLCSIIHDAGRAQLNGKISGYYYLGSSICTTLVEACFRSSGTVVDSIRYGLQLKGKKLSDSEVHKMLKLADLEISLSDGLGSELSVGQAQRVALAKTLANEPEVRGAASCKC
ncbi:ABC transporter I family member 17 [Apium graveolens]|uniref:ABC transporter I family member 17 n=1 Tax=Apium graveolens TaxID=4045 RepID=UPI003D7B55CF